MERPVETINMSPSQFVSYAVSVSRTADSWDEAEHAFGGPARWDGAVKAEPLFENGVYKPAQPAQVGSRS